MYHMHSTYIVPILLLAMPSLTRAAEPESPPVTAIQTLPGVTVTATRLPAESADAPFAVREISAEQLADRDQEIVR